MNLNTTMQTQQTPSARHPLARICRFYLDGFRSMTLGRTLWAIILVKLFVMFFVLKLFFFPNVLDTRCDDDRQRAEYVRGELAPPPPSADINPEKP